jgi:hypothetical protein
MQEVIDDYITRILENYELLVVAVVELVETSLSEPD